MRLLFAMVFSGYLLLFPARAADAARGAMALWAHSVAPALFPFMVLTPVLTGEEAQALYDRFFGRLLGKGFRLPGSAASAVTVGLIAGTPTGALAVRRAYDAGALNDKQALIAGILASGAGPVFLVCSVGGGMFFNPYTGAKILLCADMALLLSGALFSRIRLRGALIAESVQAKNSGEAAVFRGVTGALVVCGWMTLFGVLAGAFPERIRWVFEISAGCDFAARRRLPLLAAFVCGTGGACSLCQNVSALKTSAKGTCAFICAKLACGALSTGLYWTLDRAKAVRSAQILEFWARGRESTFLIAAITALAVAFCVCVCAGILLRKRRTGFRK